MIEAHNHKLMCAVIILSDQTLSETIKVTAAYRSVVKRLKKKPKCMYETYVAITLELQLKTRHGWSSHNRQEIM
jgi:hypothetical protein